MKKYILILIIITFLGSYITGSLQFWVFGDFTNRFAQTFDLQEDDNKTSKLLIQRWKIIHFIDQF